MASVKNVVRQNCAEPAVAFAEPKSAGDNDAPQHAPTGSGVVGCGMRGLSQQRYRAGGRPTRTARPSFARYAISARLIYGEAARAS